VEAIKKVGREAGKLAILVISVVGREVLNELKNVDIKSLTDTVENLAGGRRNLEEWCKIAAKPVDDAVAKTISEDGLQFVGGYLSFTFSDSSKKKVIIAYEIYFVDSQKNWTKQNAGSEVYANNFTQDALEEISGKGTVKFDVEE
jgi:predicted aldo/keto reductase-like oxidoreductase